MIKYSNAMARRLSSVRPSVCKLLHKSLILADKWPDRHQTCTRWTPGQRASRVCSRSRSKVTWYTHFVGFLEWATPSLTVWFDTAAPTLTVPIMPKCSASCNKVTSSCKFDTEIVSDDVIDIAPDIFNTKKQSLIVKKPHRKTTNINFKKWQAA